MYIHKNNLICMIYAKDKKYGKEVEEKFRTYAESKGLNVIDSSDRQNIYEHFDFKVTNSSGKTIKVEVKGEKRVNKSEPLSKDYTWIEFVGITGHEGWMFGEADYMAFDRGDEYTLVKRTELLEEVVKKVFLNYCTYIVKENGHIDPVKNLYKLYQREKDGRKDLMVLIPLTLLDKIGKKL